MTVSYVIEHSPLTEHVAVPRSAHGPGGTLQVSPTTQAGPASPPVPEVVVPPPEPPPPEPAEVDAAPEQAGPNPRVLAQSSADASASHLGGCLFASADDCAKTLGFGPACSRSRRRRGG